VLRKPALWLFVLLSLAIEAGAQQDATSSALQKELEAMAAQHHGKVALYAHQLKSGQMVALDAEHVVQTASTIKLSLYVEGFHQIKDGKKHLSDKIIFTSGDKVIGSGLLQYLRTPKELTLEDALVLMMIESDNTATNLLIDQFGLANANARAKAMGLENTYFYKKVFKRAEGPMPADQKAYGLGKTTPREIGRLMESIVNCELDDATLCKKMVDIMRNQQYRNMIPHYLEAGLDASEGESAVADKTGSLDALRADVGVVYTKAGPIVIAAYTYENKDQSWVMDNEGELLIAHMAKEIVDAWGK
jgi:beta-lactamase class A